MPNAASPETPGYMCGNLLGAASWVVGRRFRVVRGDAPFGPGNPARRRSTETSTSRRYCPLAGWWVATLAAAAIRADRTAAHNGRNIDSRAWMADTLGASLVESCSATVNIAAT